MRAPAFWGPGRRGIKAALLAPASWLYGAAIATRAAISPPPWRASVPVVCAGNVTTGGSGKTPVAVAVAARLAAMGHAPHFLTRGYGGTAKGPLRVDPQHHTAADVGDEALLLAARQPTWVGADRAESAKSALAAGAGVLIMDDGLQNPTLHRDLGLLVFDGGFGIGNGHLLPAGPLREPLAAALKRARAVVIVGADETGVGAKLPAGIEVLVAEVTAGPGAAELAGKGVVAFAGIGRPEKFFATLEATGADVLDRIPFPDHYAFKRTDIDMLTARARQLGARLVTTEKDWVRLDRESRATVLPLPIELRWRDPAALDALLVGELFAGGGHAG